MNVENMLSHEILLHYRCHIRCYRYMQRIDTTERLWLDKKDPTTGLHKIH